MAKRPMPNVPGELVSRMMDHRRRAHEPAGLEVAGVRDDNSGLLTGTAWSLIYRNSKPDTSHTEMFRGGDGRKFFECRAWTMTISWGYPHLEIYSAMNDQNTSVWPEYPDLNAALDDDFTPEGRAMEVLTSTPNERHPWGRIVPDGRRMANP
ncbi:hypothetical protein F4775DRAFT_587607 [Biscogniauxia sp. FL1348]|nr:hypothetical protein F4775DRAFT_587607 [Biscogniauxia sp. FL1348]